MKKNLVIYGMFCIILAVLMALGFQDINKLLTYEYPNNYYTISIVQVIAILVTIITGVGCLYASTSDDYDEE